jgi:hypothetical protein
MDFLLVLDGWDNCSVGAVQLACATRVAGFVIFADGDGLGKSPQNFFISQWL